MGQHGVTLTNDPEAIRAFTRAVLDDLEGLERLLELGGSERDQRRAGIEQEMFLVDGSGRAAPVGPEVLARVDDPRLTSELARFNLEANLPPRPVGGTFLADMEAELREVLEKVAAAADPRAKVLLTGILPSLQRSDLGLHNMTPENRYAQLNAVLGALRGGSFHVHIRGIDTLDFTHDSVMLESANTSLQLHLQVAPEDFAQLYNLAQLISAPMLAAAANSPVLLARRLWRETRVALFQQATDDRTRAEQNRGRAARVFFGTRWIERSVLEVFRESSARFPAVFGPDVPHTDVEAIRADDPPELTALNLHNGTIWRWNRACYGVANKKAHVRIENRVLPAGPTVIDEVANAAFFYGLMQALPEAYGDVSRKLDFDDARANFVASARQGLEATLAWLDGRRVPVRELVKDELVPLARKGLADLDVPDDQISRYLDVIEGRAQTCRTGARWALESITSLNDTGTKLHILQRLTLAMLENQRRGEPVHTWKVSTPRETTTQIPEAGVHTIRQIMSTDLFTIHPEEALDRAIRIMEWHNIRHMPVETRDGDLVGVVSMAALPPLLIRRRVDTSPLAVSAAMEPTPPTVHPDTSIEDALSLLLAYRGHCLLVTTEDQLVGIVTERDFVRAAQQSC